MAIKKGDSVGLSNYTNAIGNLAYFLVFAIAIGALIYGFIQFRKIYKTMENKHGRFWLLNLPGILLAATVISFIRWTIILLPHILDIANKITGVEKTRELFIRLIKESFYEPDAIQAFTVMMIITGTAILIVLAAYYLWRDADNLQTQTSLGIAWLVFGIGALVFKLRIR